MIFFQCCAVQKKLIADRLKVDSNNFEVCDKIKSDTNSRLEECGLLGCNAV
jgi:hypothetical protein